MQHLRPSAIQRLVLVAALSLLALAVPAIASAHTGSIGVNHDCNHGTRVVAHLDDNVADTATWELRIRDTVVDNGTGPGPADLGPYQAGFEAGDARLTIDYEQEKNVYAVDWGVTQPCPIEVEPGGSPPARYRPDGSFIGPCEDPMYAARFDNRGSNRAVTFRWRRVDGGVFKVIERTVPAGRVIRTAFRHVDGLSWMRIRARGETIASKRSAPGGNYRVCPR